MEQNDLALITILTKNLGDLILKVKAMEVAINNVQPEVYAEYSKLYEEAKEKIKNDDIALNSIISSH